jgi:hypothetical protein
MIFVVIFISGSFMFSQEIQKDDKDSYPKFVPYVSGVNNLQVDTPKADIKDYLNEQPARWLSVDPMTNKYPGWSPYNYSMNNPLEFIDPNGMWTASMDANGRVLANYETGDTYESLYSQMGMDMKQFTDWATSQGIQLPADATGSSIDITDQVLSNTNYNPNSNNSNCFGFVAFAEGKTTSETQMNGDEFVSVFGNDNLTQSPKTGNVALWNFQGDFGTSQGT